MSSRNKVSVYLPDNVLAEVDGFIKISGVNRSELFSAAVLDYIHKKIQQIKNQSLLSQINQAYDEPDTNEQSYLDKMRHNHSKVVDKW
ncbi:Ribbon-helix-helix protein, CopG family [Gammaproteobacteria bacterium]